MGAGTPPTGQPPPLHRHSRHLLGYACVVLAATAGVVHLALVPNVLGISPVLAVLFALNGLGYVAGIALYLSRYWLPELYVLAALYAVVTILAFFAFNDWALVSAFYVQGTLNPLAVLSKVAEALLAVSTLWLYVKTGSF